MLTLFTAHGLEPGHAVVLWIIFAYSVKKNWCVSTSSSSSTVAECKNRIVRSCLDRPLLPLGLSGAHSVDR